VKRTLNQKMLREGSVWDLLREAELEDSAWYVKNKATGQTFGPYPGKTAMQAKQHLLSTQPSLSKIHPADLSAWPFGEEEPQGGYAQQQASSPEAQSGVPGGRRFPRARAQPMAVGSDPTAEPGTRTAGYRQPSPSRPAPSFTAGQQLPGEKSRGSRFTKNEPFSFDDETTLAEPPKPKADTGAQTVQTRVRRPGASMAARMGDTDVDVPDLPSVAKHRTRDKGMRDEGMGVAAMGANAPMGRDSEREAFKEAVRQMVREIVRKKEGGGGYRLYPPNKGKKKKNQKPVGEFPTRFSAKKAELARFPPKDPEQLKKMRARIDRLSKDPKRRADAERRDLTGTKHVKKSGAPARERKKRKEEFVRLMARDLHERLFEGPGMPIMQQIPIGAKKAAEMWGLSPFDTKKFIDLCVNANMNSPHYFKQTGMNVDYTDPSVYDVAKFADAWGIRPPKRPFGEGQSLRERLFHEDEIPGSPWDEQMTSLHPDAISSDRKLHALHRGMEKASIGALGDAHRGLAKALRGIVKVQPGDVSFDGERKKQFMPVMLDCDGFEIGPVHLYVDGGHVRIELSNDARQAIAQLEPDTARDLRGGLMSFEEDHLPRIDGAHKAWRDRDAYLDKLHGRLSKHAAGMSGVEHHIMKGLLGKKGKSK
jgi:hypothetical protein